MSHPNESDSRRTVRVSLAHRKALLELQRVTLRYQVHNELVELAAARRRAALEHAIRGLVVLALFALAACGGPSFSSAAGDVDAGEVLQVDAGDVDAGEVLQMDAGDAAIARPDVATNDVLEHDAGDVDASSSTDAGAGGDVLELDAGDVDARACVVITGYTCAVSGYPYPARCDSLPCCCATP